MAKVYFASDHAGFALKAALIEHVRANGHEAEDLGPHALDLDDDYPDFVTPCAYKVAEGNSRGEAARVFGIIIGASGQGEAMCANRVPGVRAAVFYGEPPHPQTDVMGISLGMVSSARAHNDANVLSIGARFVEKSAARAAVDVFLEAPFSRDPRHVRRLAKF